MFPFFIPDLNAQQWLAVFIGMLLIFVACVFGGIGAANTGQAMYDRALKQWLTDCHKPLETCAADWDRSYTLRSIYQARVTPKD